MKTTLILLSIFVLIGCRSKTIYIPVETVRVEYKDRFSKDSVYLKDSIFLQIKGDTVFLEKHKYIYKNKIQRDSIFLTDSIRVPYPVEVTKEINRLKWWQEILIYLGLLSLGVAGYKVYRIFK